MVLNISARAGMRLYNSNTSSGVIVSIKFVNQLNYATQFALVINYWTYKQTLNVCLSEWAVDINREWVQSLSFAKINWFHLINSLASASSLFWKVDDVLKILALIQSFCFKILL